MRNYIRMRAPGGQYFLTRVTHRRLAILTRHDHVERLRAAFADTMRKHPFRIWAAVILPDHLHVLIELPPNDGDFSTRISLIKSRFKPNEEPLELDASVDPSRRRRREREVWQRRFWEHTIRDARDFEAHMDYIHYNPTKHGYASCPHAWPYSSFQRWVGGGRYALDWACSCVRVAPPPATVLDLSETVGE